MPARAGVVQVDVRQEQVPDVGEREPALRQAGLQRVEAGRRPAVEERQAVVGLDEVDADDTLGLVVQVDGIVGVHGTPTILCGTLARPSVPAGEERSRGERHGATRGDARPGA